MTLSDRLNKMRRVAAGLIGASKLPYCTVCGMTSDALFQKMKYDALLEHGLRTLDPLLIRRLIGVCPKCRKAYCNNHCIAANPNSARDEVSLAPRCPTDGAPLDVHWDQEPSADKPWRMGIRRT
jgi:hypothetical protein